MKPVRDPKGTALNQPHAEVFVDLTEDQVAIRGWARAFARGSVRPVAAQFDQDRAVPEKLLRDAHKQGFTSYAIPQEFGGGGSSSSLDAALVAEEMAWGCVGVYSYFESVNMFVSAVLEAGTQEQKQRWLTPLCGPELSLAAFACTEAGGGSDVAAIRTRAEKVAGGYQLTGDKVFITNGGVADQLVVVARVRSETGPEGLTLFLMRGDADGVSYGPRARTMGWRASSNTPVYFERVFVPDADVLGEVGQGFEFTKRTFELSRIEVAACSIGMARAALEYAVDYANEREAFGKSIGKFQGVSFPLADAATGIHAARLLTHGAARAADRLEPFGVQASMAKLFASETACQVTSQAMQVLGGHGYMEDHPIEKWFRDARLETIEEGTSEIMRLIISRSLLTGRFRLD
jgi:alkylation response protein AidB-like acyl-CoA dehydrogenase